MSLSKIAETNWDNLLIIHYSCQALSDDNEGYSPRITSIAVRHVKSGSTSSFSIHLIAEIQKVERDQIASHYDSLEAEMLKSFYEFVSNHSNYYWVHWNMKNSNFGFEALAHRYEVLTKTKPPQVDENKRINLSRLILKRYGNDCVDDPKMYNLMELNGGRHRDLLDGAGEAKAFANKEYLKLHKSTLVKVSWFNHMLKEVLHGKIKTHRSNWTNKILNFLDHLTIKILGFIALLLALAKGGQWLYELFTKA